MQTRSKTAVLTLLLGLLAGPVLAQPTAIVKLDTNYPEAIVFADSLWLGPASQHYLRVPAQAQTLRLVSPDIESWSVAPQVRTLSLQPGDTVALHVSFPHRYQVESLPFGAKVYWVEMDTRILLGETPLRYETEEPLDGQFVVEAPGYLPMEVTPGAKLWNRHTLALQPIQTVEQMSPADAIAWKPPRQPRRWIDYTALGLGLAAGVVAVHYKFKADRRFDTCDGACPPDLERTIDRYDTYSGIALGVSQAGLSLFALRLVFR